MANLREVVIVGAARTPIGSFSAHSRRCPLRVGAVAIKAAWNAPG